MAATRTNDHQSALAAGKGYAVFLYDAWYIVAESREVSDRPLARTILNLPLVIFKTAAGEIVALEDRCPHRLVPLSLGTVMGNNLRCAYHGAEFGPDGACVAVPGQKAAPRSVKVRSYPAVQKHGYIWAWMGDPALSSDQSLIPEGYWRSDAEGWRGGYGLFASMKVDYRLLNDNVIDITHAEFVHPETFGGQEVHFFRDAKRGLEFRDRAMTYDVQEKSLHFRTMATSLGDEGGPLWRMMLAQSHGLAEWKEPVLFTMEVSWWGPSYCSFLMKVRPEGQPDAPAAEMCNLHAAIPETETTTHYFYRSVRNYGDERLDAMFSEAADTIFSQDKPILEAQQRIVGNRDIFDHKPASFSGDLLTIEARRILQRLIESQSVGTPVNRVAETA